MPDSDRLRLRARFDEVATLYAAARPGYPGVLFDDLAALAGLRPGALVLEVGCGTGQATEALAARGYEVVAVELGERMARVARQRLAACPNVRVEVCAFEDWPVPAGAFDLVFAATAWHWLDAAIALPKARAALRPGGHLAVVATDHVAGGTQAFFDQAQDECYARWMGADATLRLTPPEAMTPDPAPLLAGGCFEVPRARSYVYRERYTRSRYLDVLRTYSSHRDLPPDRLAGLLGCVGELIDTTYGGAIEKAYCNELIVVRRAPGPARV